MKKYFLIRYNLIKLAIVNTWQRDTAYLFNNWGNFISGTVYILTAVLANSVIYTNTSELAGLTKNEMLLFIVFAQLNFYLFAGLIYKNVGAISSDINSGKLDLVLSKPVPALFFLSYRSIDILTVVRDYLFGFIFVILSVDWSALNIGITNFFLSLIIVFCGIIASSSVFFITAILAFWLGESSGITDLAVYTDYDFVKNIPFNGWGDFKTLFLTGLPFLIGSGVSVEVALGKLDGVSWCLFSTFITFLFLFFKNRLWKLGLKSYSSASS